MILSFADFVNFVNAEAGIATDPVFSREARRRLDGTSDRPDRSSKGRDKSFGKSKTPGNHNVTSHHASSHAADVTANQQSGLRTPISLCKLCNNNHDLDDCQDYLNKSLSQRKDFLKKKSLCFACYSPGHRSNGCAQRRTCKSCSRRHPTGLHDDSLALNQEASKQVSSTPPQPQENVLNGHKEVEEALCNAVGTEESVTAVPVVPVRLKSAESEVLTYAMLDTCRPVRSLMTISRPPWG